MYNHLAVMFSQNAKLVSDIAAMQPAVARGVFVGEA